MERGCPLLRMAYIIAKALETKDTLIKVDVKDARCMDTYCAVYDRCQKVKLGKE